MRRCKKTVDSPAQPTLTHLTVIIFAGPVCRISGCVKWNLLLFVFSLVYIDQKPRTIVFLLPTNQSAMLQNLPERINQTLAVKESPKGHWVLSNVWEGEDEVRDLQLVAIHNFPTRCH